MCEAAQPPVMKIMSQYGFGRPPMVLALLVLKLHPTVVVDPLMLPQVSNEVEAFIHRAAGFPPI